MLNNNSLVRFIIISISIFLLAACGSSSNSPSPSPNPSPTPNTTPSPTPTPTDSCPVSTLGTSSKPAFFEKVQAPGNILVFSKTSGFRHDSISAGRTMLQNLANSNGWTIQFTEDANQFNASSLDQFNIVVWLNTTGDVLNDTQQNAFENYIESGGAYLGLHSAADTEYGWPWYGELVGAYFLSHPQIQSATLNVEDSIHASTEHLDAQWLHTDEWYNFQSNPRDDVEVLLSLDETSYSPGTGAMGDHPIAWRHTVGLGRSFYSGLGHTAAAYSNSDFIAHIEGALIWAGRMDPEVPEWSGAPPPISDFSTRSLASGINAPMALEIAKDGSIFVIGRRGEFYAMENDSLNLKSTIPVNDFEEGGLIGFALDPNFDDNAWIYFHYTDPNLAQQNLTRITLNSDNTLDFSSEINILSYPTQYSCCHVAGDLNFDSNGNLFIATGDNTNPFESNGYAPIDERAGRSVFDAQRTSANTNDLRGKILRIRPHEDGSYSIPEGNLFTGDSEHRAEIYAMGLRNPFRITIDTRSDYLYWGDVGPDAGGASASRGPGGYDEINQTRIPGFFGWPYFAGFNEAYNDFNFSTSSSGDEFDPSAVVNNSVNNTGATNLPNAIESWVRINHQATMVGEVYRWNNKINDPYRLPSYFNGRLINWNFNNDVMYEIDVNSSNPTLRNWVNTSVLNGIIDAKISPLNGRLYLLAYGGNCCATPSFAGRLAEVRYIGDGPVQPNEPESEFEVGNTISIEINGSYVSAIANSDLALSDTNTSNNEIFEIVDAGDDGIALRSVSSGLYVSAGTNGEANLSATATEIGINEQFQLIENSDGSVSLRAYVNCQYVSLNGSSNSTLIANASSIDTNEVFGFADAIACEPDASYGIACRPSAAAYLNMPQTLAIDLSNAPSLLSQTGVFDNVSTLEASDEMIPFDLISPLWSDRAEKQRWVSVPSPEKIQWAQTGKWQWPAGTVFVKHFELPINESDATQVKRLETRITVIQDSGNVYGVTYKWRDDHSDADLLTSVLDEAITIESESGDWVQTWTYPSPEDCVNCHNPESSGVLGPKTASLNKEWQYPSGTTDNQLRTLINLGLFDQAIDESDIASFPAHAAINDDSASVEHRVRSYWDINCANCHGPQGIAAIWDARIETALESQGLIYGALAEQRDYFTDYGLVEPYVVEPQNKENSILYIRDKSIDPADRMPPLGRQLEDTAYLELLETWIDSLPTNE